MAEKEILKYVDSDTGQIYDSAQELSAVRELREREELERKERELKDRNPDFIQLYKGISPEIIATIASKSGQAIEVLMFFMQNMSHHNTIVISQKTMAETLDMNERAIRRSIKLLEEYGSIGIGKVGNANVYFVNPSVAWQRRDSEKKIAIMKANVVFGKDEANAISERFQEAVVNAKNNSRLSLKRSDTTTIKLANPRIKPEEQPTQTEKQSVSMEHLEEMEYSDSTLPEDVPPWEEQ